MVAAILALEAPRTICVPSTVVLLTVAVTPVKPEDALMADALAMALHYLRSSGSNVPGATRKAVQALGALNRLEMLSLGSGAHTTGRA